MNNLNLTEENFGLIGQSQEIHQILLTVEQVAPTDISVLIFGESGTGKELVANAIHEQSLRRDQPLVVVNCGAIPEGILESELFGHEKGAFTGAVGARKGYFEMADSGSVFLDEIGEMPLATQVKLLRVLENGDFMRVGGSHMQKVDVRIIAATNKDLAKAVSVGEFRDDLYYRLNAIHIRIPPLRERREDIHLLIRKFAADFSRDNHIEFEGFGDTALRIMESHPWPGNVRELKNVIESMIVLEKGRLIDEYAVSRYLKPPVGRMDRNLPVPLNKSSEQIEREFIYHALLELKSEISKLREDFYGLAMTSQRPKSLPYYSEVVPDVGDSAVAKEGNSTANLEGKTLEEVERHMINQALESCGGSKRKAAKSLAISERTLYRKIKEYDLPF
ncbi:MAG: sigma-54-dependent Fis family transcriptional regulator [Caldithrix sp.]|nr:MAG: sigma-54-dependent Fis family transcriptional regulator [Caldithrix sp.]